MKKFSLEILMILKNNYIETAIKSLSIPQIMATIPEDRSKSYSTVYRHLQEMFKQGYVKCGLYDGLASTYYITDFGKEFCESQRTK